jgi:zinc transport system substrate-binding protein
MKYAIGIIILVIIGFGVTQVLPSNTSERSNNDTLAITTSFYPLQFALEAIVGDLGEVTNIGAGRDPHDFRPSTQDILTLQRSDLVVLQGADFEPWGHDVEEQLEADGVPVIIATANLSLMEGGHEHDDHEEEVAHDDDHGHDEEEGHDDHDHGEFDPHTWVDPILFKETVEHLMEEIIALDPSNADAYKANAASLITELEALDASYQSRLTNCTLDEVITSHDAFSYVAKRYNFTIHSIAGLSTQDTPSVVTLAELREEASEGISAILLEENSITAYGETLARETGLQTLSINPIAYIIPEGEDYLNLMAKNLETFATALQCND